jgi:chromosome segregation ATPase
MRQTSWLALAALFIAPAAIAAQGKSQQSVTAPNSTSAPASQTAGSSASSAQQEDPLAAAARKAREERKNAPKAVKVFDNDNLPTAGGISMVGEASAPEKSEKGKAAAAGPSGKLSAADWRAKFASLRQKLQQDQSELSVMQRELGQQMMQYYGGDPNKAVQDQESGKPLGEQYDKTKAAIAEKQKQVQADQQAISEAQDQLRQAGGDPGWAR